MTHIGYIGWKNFYETGLKWKLAFFNSLFQLLVIELLYFNYLVTVTGHLRTTVQDWYNIIPIML